MIAYRVTRDVTQTECPWLDRDFKTGETVYRYDGATYGCISGHGIAVTEKSGEDPFMEFPRSALEIDYELSD